jgi:hypothetical protein
MATTFTFASAADVWPSGTTVSAFRTDSFGTATGSAVTTAAVGATGSLTFTGLADGTSYVASASGRTRRFRTDPVASSTGGGISSDLMLDLNATKYGFSTLNTGSENVTSIMLGIADAEAAAANGWRPVLTARKAGIYDVDFPGHTLLMADITIPAPATPFTLSLKSVADYPDSGTVMLSDHGFSTLLASQPVTAVVYTGRNTTTNQLTGCTAAAGAGRLFKTGMLASQPGIGEDRPVISSLLGDYDIDMPGVKWRADDVITYNQGGEAGVYGPEIFRAGRGPRSSNDQTGTLDMLTNDIRPGQQWASVRASVQPNSTFDGNYVGTYAVDDSVLLIGDKPADLDNSRTNPKGEKKDLVTARTFGTYVKTTVSASGTPNIVADAPLNNSYPMDPNNASTTIATTALTSGTMEVQLASGGVAALTMKNNRIHLADDTPLQAGLLQIDDGTNKEIVYFEDVDPFTDKIYLQQRAMVGTTSPASFAAGTTVRVIMLILIDNELFAYSKAASGLTFTVRARALNGTVAASHAAGTPIFLVPPPGWIFFGLGYQGRLPILRRYSNTPTTALLTAMTGAGTYLQGIDQAATVIVGSDFGKFDLYGAVKIGSEICTYSHRTNRRLYGVTRGAQGTTIASHTTVATISQVPIGVKLAADITSSATTTLTTNGAHFWGPTGRAKYLRVGREQMLMSSGASATGNISWVKTTLGAAAALGDTTLTLASTTNLVDPVATGVGFAFLLLDDGSSQEVISYTAISGSTVTGVIRGYATRALAHANGIDVYQYKTIKIGSSGRGIRGTTAGSTATDPGYTANSNIDWIDAGYAQKLQVCKAIHIRGLHIFCTTTTRKDYPRTISSGGVGSAGGSTGNRRSAFAAYYTTDFQVMQCKMHRTEREAVKLFCAWDSKITHNEMIGCNMQGSGAGVDNIGCAQDTLIAHNVMRDCRHGGIQSAGPDNPGVPRRTTFSYNHVQDMVNAGWESQGSSSDCIVSYNTFLSSPGRAILINSHEAKLIGNTIRFIPDFAIEIGNMGLAAGDYEVKDNDIEHCGAGIWCQSDSNNSGFYQSGRLTVQITNNRFRFLNTGQMVRVENMSAIYPLAKLSAIQITGNILRESDYQQSAGGATSTTISNGGSPVAIGSTSLPVTSTAAFASAGTRLPFFLLVDTEVLKVTAIADATHFTVAATLASHADATSVKQYVAEQAAIFLKDVRGAVIAHNQLLDLYDEVEGIACVRSDNVQVSWNQMEFAPAHNGSLARPAVSMLGCDRPQVADNLQIGCQYATPYEVLHGTNQSVDSASNVSG